MTKIALIMGSKSDLPALEPFFRTLKQFGLTCEAHVMSAHRTPQEAAAFASSAADKGIAVICAAAGKAAHLAGVLAGHTILPVIGIPMKSSTLDGLDSLLSTVQMPSGVPVATVAIDGAANAALLAIQILALGDAVLREKLLAYKQQMAQGVKDSDGALQEEIGRFFA